MWQVCFLKYLAKKLQLSEKKHDFFYWNYRIIYVETVFPISTKYKQIFCYHTGIIHLYKVDIILLYAYDVGIRFDS